MSLTQVPLHIELLPITELSPSRYTWLKDGCAYSFLLETSLRTSVGPNALMPPISYNNVIGTIIHKIFQLVNSNQLECDEDVITQKWMELCQEQKSIICKRFPTIRNVAIGDYDAMFDTIDVAKKMRSKKSSEIGSCVKLSKLNEHYIKIDCLLKGSIDRIRPTGDGYEIVDYKTGEIYDDTGEIKQDYKQQLNLYAYMLSEKEKVDISGLVIIDRFGNEIHVPFEKNRKEEVFSEVKQIIKKINDAVNTDSADALCRPSAENCNFCSCQHLCKNRIVSPDSPFHIIEGTVSQVLNNDQITITVDGLGDVVIAKLGILGIDNLSISVGKRLVFVNILQIIEGKQYNRCDKTVIYERI